jgi:hypothetical protein
MRVRTSPLSTACWLRWFLVALASLVVLLAHAQVINEDALRKVKLADHAGPITCLEVLADGRTVVAGCGSNGGLLILDTAG